jgi:FAD/FMN-containing dehydrogenase
MPWARRLRGGAHGQRPHGEGFVAVSPEARKKFWLDRARTAAPSPAHQRLQDQRGRGDPAARLGEYTDGIERINIEHVHRPTSCCWSREMLESPRAGQDGDPSSPPAARRDRRRPLVRGQAPRSLHARALVVPAAPPRRLACTARLTRSPRTPCSEFERRAGASARATGCSTCCCRTADLRVSWKPRCAAPLEGIFDGAGLRAALAECEAIHQRVLHRPRVRGAAHARRRRQRAHQHPGQLRRLRHAAARPTRPCPHHALAATSAA